MGLFATDARIAEISLSAYAVLNYLNSFADHNEFSQIYGFIVLPVAIAFCIYALRTYIRR